MIAATADGGLIASWNEAWNGVITSIEGHRDDPVRFSSDGKVAFVICGRGAIMRPNLAIPSLTTIPI